MRWSNVWRYWQYAEPWEWFGDQSVLGCENCPFKTKRIGSRGPIDSPFVIVGESPGAQELAKGVPFVGPSGRMLDDILAEVGFDDLKVEPYITNALSCYPVDKDVPKMQHATSCCQSRLRAELEAHPRDVILCLGASASWSVTGDYGIKITRDRGKVYKSDLARRGVILAVHPAYLMRNGGGLPFWKKDLKSAVDLFKGELATQWVEPEWEVIDTRENLERVVGEYTSTPDTLTTADYETTGFNSLYNDVLCLGFTKGSGNLVHVVTEDCYYGNLDLVKKLLESENIRWNWHNGKFDVQWAWVSGKEYGEPGIVDPEIRARVDEDTMLLSYAYNENAGFHDLDQVAQAWIGAPSHKKAMDKYYKMAPHYNLRNAPKDELYKYNAFDISKTHKSWVPLREEINSDPRLKHLYEKILIPGSGFFARIEQQGLLVDKAKVEENLEKENTELCRILEGLQTYAKEHLGHEINFGSWQQLRPLIWGKMRLGPPGAEREPLKYASDEDALVEAQRRTNHPILHGILEHREVIKRKGTYVEPHLDLWKKPNNRKTPILCKSNLMPNGRLYYNLLLHGTTTGRPACRNPNLLNIPRGPMIRSQYKASPGKIFVEVDLNQAELRCLALLSSDPILMDIYTKNEVSIHDVTTEAFFATLLEMSQDPSVLNRCADLLQYFGERTPKLVYHEAKMAAKTVNFGIVYGREAHSIAQVFNVSHQEAQRWIDTWLGTYKGAAEYIQKCRMTIQRNQTMVTPFGRKKRVGVATPEKLHALQNEAANFPHQSIAHDITLSAGIECEDEIHRLGGRFWLDLYDALYFEIDADDERVAEAISLLQRTLTRIPRDYGLTKIPFIGDAKIGYNWGYMKDWKGSIEETLGRI
jgi:uracil-DNA glycosylase family 4